MYIHIVCYTFAGDGSELSSSCIQVPLICPVSDLLTIGKFENPLNVCFLFLFVAESAKAVTTLQVSAWMHQSYQAIPGMLIKILTWGSIP